MTTRKEPPPRETLRQRVMRERAAFNIPPWAISPSEVPLEGDPPAWMPAHDGYRQTWAEALRLKREILETYGSAYFDFLPEPVVAGKGPAG